MGNQPRRKFIRKYNRGSEGHILYILASEFIDDFISCLFTVVCPNIQVYLYDKMKIAR